MLVRAWTRSFGVRATLSNCSEQLRPLSTCREFIRGRSPMFSPDCVPSCTATVLNVRDWIHVDDHNSAVWAIIDGGRISQTYLIGADGGVNNRTVMESILQILGRGADEFDFVTRPPGADVKYAIDFESAPERTWLVPALRGLPQWSGSDDRLVPRQRTVVASAEGRDRAGIRGSRREDHF
ncbi:unnamed protein product, partial [Mesorhabditis spiculigera]